MRKITVLFFLFSIILSIQAQQYAIVIKGGHIIDPRNNINEVMDIAINDGKVVTVAKNIDARQATQVVNAKGLYVTPGLIDIHGHFFYGTDPDNGFSNGTRSIAPDGFTFRAGVTTVVDAGGAGWRNFPLFKKQVIDNSQTRVLSLLNIVGDGMKGILYEQNTHDMDAKMTALVAKHYPEYIVGVKVAHFLGQEWTPVEEAVKAGNAAGIPVMVDFGSSQPQLSIQDLFLKYLRPGDIFTHCFGQLKDREPVVDINNQQVKPFVLEAQRKGVVFDVGYGELSFTFSQAIPAIRSGFYPNSISTDIHSRSMNLAMKEMIQVMSKLMAIGMDLPGVIRASTWNPAKEIKHEELGHLSPGAIADIAILSVRKGKFGYYDYTGYKIEAPQKLECEMTIKGGKIVYDLNGIATPVIVINQKK